MQGTISEYTWAAAVRQTRDGSPDLAPLEPLAGFDPALGWLWDGFGVALEWLWGAYPLAINTL